MKTFVLLLCGLSSLAVSAVAGSSDGRPTLALHRSRASAQSPAAGTSSIPNHSTSTRQVSAPTATSTLSLTRQRTCKCGYSRAGTYLPKLFSIDFTKVNTPEAISATGMFITDTFDYGVGSTAPDGTTAYGQASNIRSAGSDGIAMVVPGGQTAGGRVTAAEMSFQGSEGEGMTKIIAEIEMRIDPTPGTCQAMFTYTADYADHSDEQDIEIIAASLMKASSVAPAGVQLTNYDPTQSGDSDFRILPFPRDPSKAFHKYTIAWANGQVEYLFDGQLWKGPTKFVSVNPSNVVINHWATGELGFFGAPLPAKDVIMKVKNLKVYYATESTWSMPKGCTTADICQI